MKPRNKNYHCSSSRKGGIFGLLVVLIGVVLLALNFGWLNIALKPVIFSWPMLLIVIGLVGIRHRDYITTILLFGLGIFFLLPRIGAVYPQLFSGIDGSFTSVYWPILLIFVGIMLLFRHFFPSKRRCPHSHSYSRNRRHQATIIKDANVDFFEKRMVFGGEEHIFLDEFFTGGKIDLVFSGMKMDLRKTKLPEGETYLNVNAVFGGLTLFIPDNWNVVFEVDKVAASTEDKRMIDFSSLDQSRKLIIKGSAVLSGIDIR